MDTLYTSRAGPRLPHPPDPWPTLPHCPGHRAAPLPLPALALDGVPASPLHAGIRTKTGSKFITTYYSEHVKQDITGYQRITPQPPYQSQQRGQNEGRIPSVAMIAR